MNIRSKGISNEPNSVWHADSPVQGVFVVLDGIEYDIVDCTEEEFTPKRPIEWWIEQVRLLLAKEVLES